MERHCPVCRQPLLEHEIVCPACLRQVHAREPVRREHVLYGWGRGLMVFLAIFLFFKGAYATLGPTDYARTARVFDLASENRVAMALNAAFVLAAALLYAIAWMGSYLGRPWDATVCLAALVVFIAGQALTQTLVLHQEGGAARSIAVFLFWITVPIFQYCAFRMGREAGVPQAAQSGEEAV